jgi:phosphate transport system ATP-binding protein
MGIDMMRKWNSIDRRPLKAEAKDLSFYYGSFQALKGINMPIYEKKGDGADRPLRLRQVDLSALLQPHARPVSGQPLRRRDRVHPDRTNLLLEGKVDPIEVRMRISMVFQKPNPFPKSIYENVAYGLRVRGEKQQER